MKNNTAFSESENSKIISGWNHSHFSEELDLYTFQPVKNYFYRCVSGDEEGIAKENWFEDWLIKTYLKDKIPVANCLTLCCGHGERDRRLAKMGVFKNCLGLDISPGAIEACKINASNEIVPIIKQKFKNTNTHYYNGSILSYALDKKFFLNFNSDLKQDRDLLNLLIDLEKNTIASNEIPPVLGIIVSQKEQ